MTPTAPELLMGCVTALSSPPAEEDGGVYMAGKVGLVAIIDVFCAQECGQGIAIRAWENTALRQLLASADGAYRTQNEAPDASDGDLSLAALDAANADLRRRLIHLHEAVEAAGDTATDRRILALYREMSARRALHLPQPAQAA